MSPTAPARLAVPSVEIYCRSAAAALGLQRRYVYINNDFNKSNLYICVRNMYMINDAGCWRCINDVYIRVCIT